MKYLALAVLLAVIQTSAPVPKKAADPSNRAPQNVKNDSTDNQAPPQQPQTVVQPITAKPDQNSGHSPAAENTQKPVVIRELPPVSVTKDWWDRIYIIFTGILIIVGIIGVRAAYKTLIAIQRQGDQMEHQTNALRRQGVSMRRQTTILRKSATLMEGQLNEMQKSREIENKTLILQYRPKIIIRNAKALQFSSELGKPWECQFEFTVVNTGGSPAHIGVGTKIVLMSCIAHDAGNIDFKDGDTFWLKEPISLQAGAEVIIQESLPTGAMFDLGWESFRRGLEVNPPRYLFLFSRIYYTDDLNIPRSTGINRRYDPKTKAFVPKKDEEEEYAD